MNSAVTKLIRLLARLLISRGIPYPSILTELKRAYLVESERKLLLDGATKITDSRLSVMSGLQRRDIAALRHDSRPEGITDTHNTLARLVAVWLANPEFSNAGSPRALPRKGAQGSFDALAFGIRKDVHPRTLLESLLAAEVVALDAQDYVHLLQSAYLPQAGSEDQLAYLGSNVGDHFEAALANIEGREPAFFERAVHYDRLTAEQVESLETQYRESQLRLLQDLNARALSMQTEGEGRGSVRFRAGGYFFSKVKEAE